MSTSWWSHHRALAAELHVLVAAATLAGGTALAVVADASSAASVLLLTATCLVGSLGTPAWAAAAVALATWFVHCTLLVQARGLPVGPDQAENFLLFAAAAGAGWFCGRRARAEDVPQIQKVS